MILSEYVEAQESFWNLFFEVMEKHSQKSKDDFINKLKLLHLRYENHIVKITGAYHKNEFSLTWHRVDEDRNVGEPYMYGGLVYHSHSDEWGIHT